MSRIGRKPIEIPAGVDVKIEAGNVEAPDPEMAVSKLEFNGLEGYWYGHWIEGGGYLPGYMWEGAGRFTERFPYVEE